MRRVLSKIMSFCLAAVIVFSTVFGQTELVHAETPVSMQNPVVHYRAYVQKTGWLDPVTQGIAGTTGRGLRMEALKIDVTGVEGLGVRYRAHVQSIGWQNYVENGQTAGTTGKSKRLEAVQIELTGEQAANYDIYYRVHAQTYGWMKWAKNGEPAGTEGYGKRLEAIEIRILPKGSLAPEGAGKTAYDVHRSIVMRAHVQSYGWLPEVDAGELLGTTGKGKRLEAISLKVAGYDMNVEYNVHVQSLGWTGYKKNGETAGTVGQGKRLEAVRIRLTGPDADKFDVYYRAHVQRAGWLDWAKNDEIAGSTGMSYRMEALDVRLVPKNSAAPGATDRTQITAQGVTYRSEVAGQGWQGYVTDRQTSGTTGRGLAMRALQIETKGNANLGIRYSVYVNGQWQPFVENGATAGGNGDIEAVKITLTGKDANLYRVYYRVHSASVGWLGWACDGNPAGTTTVKKAAQAIEIAIVSSAQPAPGSTMTPYRDNLDTEAERYARQKLNEIGWDLRAAFNWSSSIPYAYRSNTAVPAGYTNADWYAIFGFQHSSGNCYHMAATFYQMAKLLGYNVHYVQGYLPQRNGGRVTHGWCEIEMDGGLYVFDPNYTYWTGRNGYHITYGTPGTYRYSDYSRLN